MAIVEGVVVFTTWRPASVQSRAKSIFIRRLTRRQVSAAIPAGVERAFYFGAAGGTKPYSRRGVIGFFHRGEEALGLRLIVRIRDPQMQPRIEEILLHHAGDAVVLQHAFADGDLGGVAGAQDEANRGPPFAGFPASFSA